MATVTLNSLSEFQRKLAELSFTLQQKTLIEVARAGGRVFESEMRSRAPRDTGRLAAGISVKVVTQESGIFVGTVRVAPHRKAFYAGFLEKGTRNMPAQPFIGPTFQIRHKDAMEAMKDAMIEILNRVIHK
jgi:HK97 gp10 family phage protein